MFAKHTCLLLTCIALGCNSSAQATAPKAVTQAARTCHRATFEGEVQAGQSFSQTLGGGLSLYLQPIAAGWILRVIPSSGPHGDHDYAELATPPYNSVSPLSISTDFSFRAQDAVGWNPRHFHFATTGESFQQLSAAARNLPAAPAAPTPAAQIALASLLAKTSEGTLQILDARLIPGTGDQALMAGSVASHFASTAHTIQQPTSPTPLGKLLWIRFRVTLDFPPGFNPLSRSESTPCPVT